MNGTTFKERCLIECDTLHEELEGSLPTGFLPAALGSEVTPVPTSPFEEAVCSRTKRPLVKYVGAVMVMSTNCLELE